jgi:hypothetical protein
VKLAKPGHLRLFLRMLLEWLQKNVKRIRSAPFADILPRFSGEGSGDGDLMYPVPFVFFAFFVVKSIAHLVLSFHLRSKANSIVSYYETLDGCFPMGTLVRDDSEIALNQETKITALDSIF